MTPQLCIKYVEKPGDTSTKIGWVCGTLPETLTIFQTTICDFPTLFLTWSKIWYRISDLKPWSPARDRSAWQAGYGTYTAGVNILKKQKQNEKYIYNKEKTNLAENRTWTICTESRFLDHCATLPRITLTGKIIIFKVLFPSNSASTFTVLTLRVIVKEVLPQIPRKQWWQKWKLLTSYEGNLLRHFVW